MIVIVADLLLILGKEDLDDFLARYTIKNLLDGGGECLICRKVYVHYHHCKRHFVKAHTKSVYPKVCKICHKTFPTEESLLAHVGNSHQLSVSDM